MPSRTVDADPDQWKRVAEVVYRRRLALKLTSHDVVERSDRRISKTLLSFLENARQTRYLESKLQALSNALGWTDDSVELILKGGEPIVIDDEPASSDGAPADVVGQVAALTTRLAELERWRAEWEPILVAVKEEMALQQHEMDLRRREIQAGLRKPAEPGVESGRPPRERRGA